MNSPVSFWRLSPRSGWQHGQVLVRVQLCVTVCQLLSVSSLREGTGEFSGVSYKRALTPFKDFPLKTSSPTPQRSNLYASSLRSECQHVNLESTHLVHSKSNVLHALKPPLQDHMAFLTFLLSFHYDSNYKKQSFLV